MGPLLWLLSACSPQGEEALAGRAAASPHSGTRREAPATGPRFVAAGPESGLTHSNLAGPTAAQGKQYLLDCFGPGIAVLDADSDGRLDLFFTQGRDDARPLEDAPDGGGDCADRFYRNLGGRRFVECASEVGLADRGYGFGALAFDEDSDGDSDLFVGQLGPDRLYRNDAGRFGDVTARHAGLAGGAHDWTTGAAAGDVDEDGDLDLFTCNYLRHDSEELDRKGLCRFMSECRVPCGPLGLDPQPQRFFLNEGAPDFRLREATEERGLDVEPTYGFQPLFLDVEPDGDLDLFVAVDSRANLLFVNDGRGHFSEQGLVSGVAFSAAGQAEAGMGVAAGDLDGDARAELYVTNFSTQVNSLYRNHTEAGGDPWFEEEAQRTGTGAPSWFNLAWGCALEDFDDDGWREILVSNSHVYPQVDECPPEEIVYRERCHLFRRVPGERLLFEDVAGASGDLGLAARAHRASVVADLDDDGALDVLIALLDEPPLLLWNATPARGHWLALRVETAGEPRCLAVGARIVAEAGGRRFAAEVRAGSSFLCTEDPRVHFGLGEAGVVDRLQVEWPGGARRTFTAVAADRQLILRPDVEAPLPVPEREVAR